MKNFLLLTALVFAACDLRPNQNAEEPTELRTLSESLAHPDVARLTAHLSIGAGRLFVSGGADQLMEADFEYNRASWKPEIDFEQTGDRGQLTIGQPGLADNFDLDLSDDQRNEWYVRLSNDVPLVLECEWVVLRWRKQIS